MLKFTNVLPKNKAVMKPALFYFVHAHGNGHRATFNLLYPALSAFFNVIAITTNKEVTDELHNKHDVEIVELPPKYPAGFNIPEHTFSKAFEVTPYAIEPALRAKALAEAITRYKPKAFYCDGVPELAIMIRSMGVPVVLVHLPGKIMADPTQVFAHQLADHIIAHFPSALEQEDYEFTAKTFYSGYLSKYAGVDARPDQKTFCDEVTILLGYDNYNEAVLRNITKDENIAFTVIGNKHNYNLGKNCKQLGRVPDISKVISGEVVITAAGQNSVAELLSLKKRLILLPERRPYDEQAVHAGVLIRHDLALMAQETLSAAQWQDILLKAKAFNFKKIDTSASSPKLIAQKMREWYV
jgi:UDP-N-acetylglucosamine:LPS N-acetylglucosamine transferase